MLNILWYTNPNEAKKIEDTRPESWQRQLEDETAKWRAQTDERGTEAAEQKQSDGQQQAEVDASLEEELRPKKERGLG